MTDTDTAIPDIPDIPDAEHQGASQTWIPVGRLAAHPDNPRRSLGDLTELTRSIKAHGVLMPLLVLPTEPDSEVHLIVAGHRRHAAAAQAGVTDLPVIVRAMTEVEVVEAMLVENEHRGELTIAEQIAAIERLMSLEDGLTPTKLNQRLGKSKAWVRTRMALAALPTRWRDRIDAGDLTVAAAEAATTAADLGPEHLDALLDQLTQVGHWQDPSRVVENYRRDLDRDHTYQTRLDRERARRDATVYTVDDPAPSGAKPVRDLFDADDLVKAHQRESCHAVVMRRVSWGDGTEVTAICTDPRRHRPTAESSDALVSDRTRPGPTGGDDSAAKRRGRVARTTHLTEALARPRGGPSRADLTVLALRALIHDAGQEPLKFAATVLGLEATQDLRSVLLDLADQSPTGLARVAGAVGCGLAEGSIYWSPGSGRCQEYLALLCDTGWTPDEWTAPHLTEPDIGQQ